MTQYQSSAGATPPSSFLVTIPLDETFRFVHEPIHARLERRFVGRATDVQEFADRITFSAGGSFLITGYRGVGKTSFVNQVLNTLDKNTLLLDIQISLARPLQPSELMHLIVRRLYDRLFEKHLYQRLRPALQTRLSLAYQRTSANVVRKLSEDWEGGLELSGLKLARHVVPFAPKVSAKRSRTIDLETSFLAYDDKAAEHDLISISRDLAEGIPESRSYWRTILERLTRRVRAARPIKIVFVFDEMDKLDEQSADGTQQSAVDDMLSGLKNLFTTSGISFVFVAGKDLHERWLRDLWSGDSIYESVFSYDKYLPCMWNELDELCDYLTTVDGDDQKSDALVQKFKNYLRFKGRGIPRRMLRAFNEMVLWDQGKPVLAFTNESWRRVKLFADLNQLLESNARRLFSRSTEDVSGTRQDRYKLGIYYVVDWILRQGYTTFTVGDVLTASSRLSSRIALAEKIAPSAVAQLMDTLIEGEYVETVTPKLDEAAIGGGPAKEPKLYKLVARRVTEMSDLGSVFEEEESFAATADNTIARFELHEELGAGGMGKVYRAWDTARKIFVALKVLHPWLSANPDARARFKREFSTLRSLKHENIVKYHEDGESQDKYFMAMDLIEGLDLKTVIATHGAISIEIAATILIPIARAAQYAHDLGFVRLDMKPSNIMVSFSGHVYLMDLGIAKPMSDPRQTAITVITQTGDLVGTPMYLAPEQFGPNSADRRSDVYAFGVVLYELVTGSRPFSGTTLAELIGQHLYQSPAAPSSTADVSTTVDSVILRCLEKDPDRRFQTMSELVDQLQAHTRMVPSSVLSSLVAETQSTYHSLERKQNSSTQRFVAQVADTPTFGDLTANPATSTADTAFPIYSGRTGRAVPPVPFGPRIEIPSDKTSPIFPMTIEPATIGRAVDNTIQLEDAEGVSRYHARILRRDERFLLVDLNSSNGTLLNGKRILDPAPLSDHDVITIGSVLLVFRTN